MQVGMGHALAEDTVLPIREHAVVSLDEVAYQRLEPLKFLIDLGPQGGEVGIVHARDEQHMRLGERRVIGDDEEVAPFMEEGVLYEGSVAERASGVGFGSV
jgi:hypothetical protein